MDLHHLKLLVRLTSPSQELTNTTVHAFVVADLDGDLLAGTPFMISNNILVHPAKGQVLIQGSEVISYH